MPITGLTNRELGFPVIGKIRKGAQKQRKTRKDGSEYETFGQELTYFRFDLVEGEEDTAAELERIYGKEPKAIRVLFPFNEIDRVWSAWKVAFTAGTMLGKSDGAFVNFLQDNKGNVIVRNGINLETGHPHPHPANNVAGYDYKGKAIEFENSGILKVMLWDLPRAAYLEVVTGSDNDIANIDSQLRAFLNDTFSGGRLAGIPFILRRVPRMISTPGNNKDEPRARRKKYLINIEVDPDWIVRQFGKMRALALPTYGEELPPAGVLPPGTTLETEFDPDELDGEPVDLGEPETEPGESPAADPEPQPAKRMVEVLGEEAVSYAAKTWNVEKSQAAKDLARKNLGKLIAWDDLVRIVQGE